MDEVFVTESFIGLAQDWPAVSIKINLHTAGISGDRAKSALEQAASNKRKRDEDGAAASDEP